MGGGGGGGAAHGGGERGGGGVVSSGPKEPPAARTFPRSRVRRARGGRRTPSPAKSGVTTRGGRRRSGSRHRLNLGLGRVREEDEGGGAAKQRRCDNLTTRSYRRCGALQVDKTASVWRRVLAVIQQGLLLLLRRLRGFGFGLGEVGVVGPSHHELDRPCSSTTTSVKCVPTPTWLSVLQVGAQFEAGRAHVVRG